MALLPLPKNTFKFPQNEEKKDVVGISQNYSGQLKGFFLGKASWLTDSEGLSHLGTSSCNYLSLDMLWMAASF